MVLPGDCARDSVIASNDIQKAIALPHGLLRCSIKRWELPAVGPDFPM
jgi:hypothetical protein